MIKFEPVTFRQWRHDLPAGLVVFLVALPLCLGISLASGAPLFAGILAGVIGGIVVGFLSGSQISVSGPAAGLITIVLGAIQGLGFEGFLAALVLAGVLQLVMGYLKAGVIGYYFPSAVIKGMLAGIGLILILKQFPHAMGYDQDVMGEEAFFQFDGETTFSEIWISLTSFAPGALIIALVSLAILIFWERPAMQRRPISRLIPGALVAVVAGILLNQLFGWVWPVVKLENAHLVQISLFDNSGKMNQLLTWPDFGMLLKGPQVYVSAFTIALVASIETLLSLEAVDKLDPHKRTSSTNQELKAQGIANILSGLVGGLPITSVIVRSSANMQAGSRTRFSAIFHGVLLLLAVLTISSVLNLIPLASLAAILLLIGYKLSSIRKVLAVYKLGWEQFLPFVVTILGILFTDLLRGIGMGLVIAFFFILKGNFHNAYFFRKETRGKGEQIVLELAQEVSFLNKASLQHTLSELPEGSRVVIDCSKTLVMDLDVREIIHDFKETARLKNIDLQIIGQDEQPSWVPAPVH